jgi:acyl dehydratase
MTNSVNKNQAFELIGKDLGVSDWIKLDQNTISAFADLTQDHQFIHVDEERAKQTPFGTTIAHGFLVLSLLAKFAEQCGLVIEDAKMGVNYGFDKVRFLSPVKVDSRVRGVFKLADVVQKKPGQLQLRYEVIVEIEGEPLPALVADWLALVFE